MTGRNAQILVISGRRGERVKSTFAARQDRPSERTGGARRRSSAEGCRLRRQRSFVCQIINDHLGVGALL